MKHKTLIKKACRNAIKRYAEKRRKTKEYWGKKLMEAESERSN